MKKILKSCIFWFIVIAVAIVYLNASGKDDKNALLYISNIPLESILQKTLFPLNGIGVTPDLFLQKMHMWYGLQIASYAFYGFVIDLIRYLIRKLNRPIIKG